MRTSRSNPDISSHIYNISANSPANALINRHSSFSTGSGGNGYLYCEQAIKVYKSDQSFRYIIICPETSVKFVVKMTLLVNLFSVI